METSVTTNKSKTSRGRKKLALRLVQSRKAETTNKVYTLGLAGACVSSRVERGRRPIRYTLWVWLGV